MQHRSRFACATITNNYYNSRRKDNSFTSFFMVFPFVSQPNQFPVSKMLPSGPSGQAQSHGSAISLICCRHGSFTRRWMKGGSSGRCGEPSQWLVLCEIAQLRFSLDVNKVVKKICHSTIERICCVMITTLIKYLSTICASTEALRTMKS